MATFEVQVEGLTGIALDGSSSPTQDELTQFLRDGVLDVTNRCVAINPLEMEKFQRDTSSDSQGVNVGGAKLISVLREAGADGSSDGSTAWRVCTQVPIELQSRVVDTTSLHFASVYNPVFVMSSDKAINVYPTPSSNNGIKVYYVNEEPRDVTNGAALTYAHENIKYFPNDKVYLVVIYASMKALQAAMGGLHTNTAIDTTALGAVVTQLNKVDDIIVEASTEFDEAKNASGSYNSGDLDTALGLIKTAADTLATAGDKWEGGTESIWGDEDTFLTSNSQLTEVKDALEKARTLMSDDAEHAGLTDVTDEPSSGTYSALYWLGEEDSEMVQSTLGMISTEIQRAQTAISHWNSMGDMRSRQIQSAMQEVGAYQSEVSAILQTMNGWISNGTAYLQEASSYIAQASGYLQEVQIRMQRDNQKYTWFDTRYQELKAEYDTAFSLMGVRGGQPGEG